MKIFEATETSPSSIDAGSQERSDSIGSVGDLLSPEFLLASLLIVATRIFALPQTPWEFDDTLFYRAVAFYDPLSHHPPPPGYPLFIVFANFVWLLIRNDFATFAGISFVASLAGFAFLTLAFRNITRNQNASIAGALFFYMSPAMLVHSTLPISDTGALALLAATIYYSTRALDSEVATARDVVVFAILASSTVGWRPQFSVVILPLLFVTLALLRSWRARLIATGTFTVVCLLWLTPLAAAVGGVEELVSFETSQASYLAEHDADVSRSGWTPTRIAFRFIAHPWGPKGLSFPLLIAASGGLALGLRRGAVYRFLPLGAAGAIYLSFGLKMMDPADGVRYALPAVLVVAFLAGSGVAAIARGSRWTYLFVAAYAIGAMFYVGPLLSQRRSSPSPPVQAADFARSTFPRNAVALYELPLWPHATYHLRAHHPLPVDQGLGELADHPDIPLYLYANGRSTTPGARVFAWRPSDAYSKLTRDQYRVVSIIPLPSHRRFRTIRGVYSLERETEGDEWRWLGREAELQLPRIAARELNLRIGVPVRYPFADNVVTIRIDGVAVQRVLLQRGKSIRVVLPIVRVGSRIEFESERSFVPAELRGSANRDPRRLAIKLYDLYLR